MSGKNRRLQQIAEQERALAASRKLRRWFVVVAMLVVAVAVAGIFRPSAKTIATKPAPAPTHPKWTLNDLLTLTPHQLGNVDIAQMNLLCAQGLRGSEALDVDKALDRIDDMATRVRVETERNLHRFQEKPGEYNHSEPYFRMLALATVLQQDFGIRYNPERVTPVGVFEPNDLFFADSRDVFLHGLTAQPGMGTCSSLPVLYVAVGRRLRYPLSLVTAKGHLFLRWQDQRERLNVEAASLGMNSHDDSHYRNWPYPFTDEEQREDGYLQNLTPAEEFAVFLTIRGACLMSAGRLDESIAAYEHAARTTPAKRVNKLMLNAARKDAARRRQPAPRTGGLPKAGMPPDPSLWNEPPEIAWILWEQQQARRRAKVLPGSVPEPMPGAPLPQPGQPLPGRNPALPFPPPAR